MEHIDAKDDYWNDLLTFMSNQMIPMYKRLLVGSMDHGESVDPEAKAPETQDDLDDVLKAIKQILIAVSENPEEVCAITFVTRVE